ncbi:MAG: hypothetical protein JWM28_1768 [Chitinophagaceae bacterium]|nr:hypothetical protein [Chitinophagaceae bacterium]
MQSVAATVALNNSFIHNIFTTAKAAYALIKVPH